MNTKLTTIIFAGLLLSTQSFANSPEQITITDFKYNGSGCPLGSSDVNLSEDRVSSFSMDFYDYWAEVGPNISRRDSRKNCFLSISLDIPAGWTLAVGSIRYRGALDLEKGVEATQKSTYFFQGRSEQLSLESTFEGKRKGSFDITDIAAGHVWSPCEQNVTLNINSQVRLNNRDNPQNSGEIGLDSIDGMIHSFNLIWKRCQQ